MLTLFCIFRYNDYPHGRFSILSQYQDVIVRVVDLQRQVRLNVTREAGSHGQVRVVFNIRYNQVHHRHFMLW